MVIQELKSFVSIYSDNFFSSGPTNSFKQVVERSTHIPGSRDLLNK